MAPSDHCVTCGTELVGRYCHQCSEKRADERDLTLRAFAHYAAEAITNADAKLYVTVRRLFARPGLLTREFVAGRRTLYVAPLQLFLIANLVFFVLLQFGIGMQAFTTDLAWHPTQGLYGPAAETMIRERVGTIPAHEGRPLGLWVQSWSEEQQELRARFNEATPRYANSMVILMIPMFAVGLRVLRRRSLFVRDLVFSMHFFAFLLLFNVAMTLLVGMAVLFIQFVVLFTGLGDQPAGQAFFRLFDSVLNSELAAAVLIVIPLAIYLAAGFRTAYGDGDAGAVLRAAASLVILFAVVTVYRGLLFFVVFHAV